MSTSYIVADVRSKCIYPFCAVGHIMESPILTVSACPLSAADYERRQQARAARQRQLQLSAGRGREAAARLRRDQLRAERAARQLAESRQLAVSRENLARQSRHRRALQQ